MAVPPGNADALPLQGKSLMHLGGEEKSLKSNTMAPILQEEAHHHGFAKVDQHKRESFPFIPLQRHPSIFMVCWINHGLRPHTIFIRAFHII